ncbi:hypothetical protein C8J56DRAFT_890012 [Mycena floridula]|nr:hypothetical protein C8J56DRAFT_890012 [Mycena floridula]
MSSAKGADATRGRLQGSGTLFEAENKLWFLPEFIWPISPQSLTYWVENCGRTVPMDNVTKQKIFKIQELQHPQYVDQKGIWHSHTGLVKKLKSWFKWQTQFHDNEVVDSTIFLWRFRWVHTGSSIAEFFDGITLHCNGSGSVVQGLPLLRSGLTSSRDSINFILPVRVTEECLCFIRGKELQVENLDHYSAKLVHDDQGNHI